MKLEFLVIGDGFSYLFLFNYKIIKLGTVEFGWLILRMPAERTCTHTAWANPGNSLCLSQGMVLLQYSQSPCGPHRGSAETWSSALRGRKYGELGLWGSWPRSAANGACELKEIISFVYTEITLSTKESGHYL